MLLEVLYDATNLPPSWSRSNNRSKTLEPRRKLVPHSERIMRCTLSMVIGPWSRKQNFRVVCKLPVYLSGQGPSFDEEREVLFTVDALVQVLRILAEGLGIQNFWQICANVFRRTWYSNSKFWSCWLKNIRIFSNKSNIRYSNNRGLFANVYHNGARRANLEETQGCMSRETLRRDAREMRSKGFLKSTGLSEIWYFP